MALVRAPLAGSLLKLALGQQLATKGAASAPARHGRTFASAISAKPSSACAVLISSRIISGEDLAVACRCACPAI
jgi:hypothetical protein